MEVEGASSRLAEKECEKKEEQCETRHETRQNLRTTLKKVEVGSALSSTVSIVLRGNEKSEDRKIEGSVVIGEKARLEGRQGEEETVVEMKMYVQSPQLRRPFEAEVSAKGQIRRPEQKWEQEEILRSDLTSKITIEGEYGLRVKNPRLSEALLLSSDLTNFTSLFLSLKNSSSVPRIMKKTKD